MAKLEELTGFDEDFFWENINIYDNREFANLQRYRMSVGEYRAESPELRGVDGRPRARRRPTQKARRQEPRGGARHQRHDFRISLHQGSRMANLQELNHFRRLHVFDLFRHARSRIISRQKGVQV